MDMTFSFLFFSFLLLKVQHTRYSACTIHRTVYIYLVHTTVQYSTSPIEGEVRTTCEVQYILADNSHTINKCLYRGGILPEST